MPVSYKKRKLTALVLLWFEGFYRNLLVDRLKLHNIHCTIEYRKAQLLHKCYDFCGFCIVLTMQSLVVNTRVPTGLTLRNLNVVHAGYVFHMIYKLYPDFVVCVTGRH